MKFTAFKEFRFSRTIESVLDYLSIDLRKFLRELQIGLTRLSFLDNFECFYAEVTIDNGDEAKIRNPLGLIPSQRIIVRGGEGSELVSDGPTPWTEDYVYLKNYGPNTVTLTVLFIR